MKSQTLIDNGYFQGLDNLKKNRNNLRSLQRTHFRILVKYLER